MNFGADDLVVQVLEQLDELLEEELGGDDFTQTETSANEIGTSDDDVTGGGSRKQFEEKEMKAMESRVNEIVNAAAAEATSGMKQKQVMYSLSITC